MILGINVLRMRAALTFWPRRAGGFGICANRRWSTVSLGSYTFTLRIKDNREPDGYERTEVLRMLRAVRAAERRMNWTCPEPDEADLQKPIDLEFM